jgi:cell shape-determining protein MreD
MAACCGFLWDYGATGIFGVRALLLSVFALAISIIVKFYVMPVFLSVTVAHASATVIYLLLEFLLMYAVRDYGSLDIILIEHYLPALIKTVLAGILISYITMKIYKLKPHISGIEL